MNKGIIAVGILLVIALATRVSFLGYINQVVFDEVHFGKFISSYCCTHERFFDIHPPIGKLLIASAAYVSGYSGRFDFASIGETFSDIPIASIRIIPALAGALLPLIFFVLLRQLGVSRGFAFVGGLAVTLENALIVESRFILTDSILLSSTFGALSLGFAAFRTKVEWKKWLFLALAGTVAGIAVGTKFTGLVGGALVALVVVQAIVHERYNTLFVWIGRSLLAILCGGAIYLLGWQLHFALLTMPGSGDVWGIPTGNFWADLMHTQEQMISANYNLAATHPYGSAWWTWPCMVRSVFYWQGQDPQQFIYLLGNPIVWWGSFTLLCLGLLSLFFRVVKTALAKGNGFVASGAWIILFGYFLAYVPLMRVPRVLFLYHYLTPLLFSLLFALWWADTSIVGRKKGIVIGASIAIVLGYIFIAPVTYGIPLSDTWYSLLFTISSWR